MTVRDLKEITPTGAKLVRKAHDALKTIHFGINGDLSEEQACEIAVVLSELRSV